MPSVPERPPITPQLAESGVVAILRGSSDRHLADVARTLGSAGVTCLELTLTTPGAVDALARVRAELSSDVALGMGSVIDAQQAAACLDAGADFLVSPGVCPEVAAYALERGVACYPGALTPTEIYAAWRASCDLVKVFPCAHVGGDKYIKSIRAALPQIQLVAAGGVNQQNAAAFILAGAEAIGIGTQLIPTEAIERRQADRIHELAQRFLGFVKDARRKLEMHKESAAAHK